MINAACPRCGSENTQAIHVLMAAGTTTGKFSGGGVSYSQGGGLGGHSVAGSMSNQTELAQRFRMPPRPSPKTAFLVLGIVFSVLTVVFAITRTDLGIGCGVFFGVIGFVLLVVYASSKAGLPHRQQAWDSRASYLQNAWFCHRCGRDWSVSEITQH